MTAVNIEVKNPEGHGDGEAFDRTGTHGEQDAADQQRGQVGIDDAE